jgi:hypothetical protein
MTTLAAGVEAAAAIRLTKCCYENKKLAILLNNLKNCNLYLLYKQGKLFLVIEFKEKKMKQTRKKSNKKRQAHATVKKIFF